MDELLHPIGDGADQQIAAQPRRREAALDAPQWCDQRARAQIDKGFGEASHPTSAGVLRPTSQALMNTSVAAAVVFGPGRPKRLSGSGVLIHLLQDNAIASAWLGPKNALSDDVMRYRHSNSKCAKVCHSI